MAEDNILWRKRFAYRSATGLQPRPVISLTYWIAGNKIKTSASVSDRSKMKQRVLIGRNDLTGYLIRPTLE